MTRRVVGILGGMGPEATILLQQRILATVRAVDDVDHVPLLIDMNPQVPSRIAHLIEGAGTDPGPVLAAMARRLETAGASALAMPCNTAHHYAADIEAAVSIPFLNIMIELSVNKAARGLSHGARVGLLASPAARMSGVFEGPLRKAGLTALWPDNTARMLDAIRTIKAEGATPKTRRTLVDAADELTGKCATRLFFACSELSLMADALPDTVPAIDTVDVLADAIHDHIFLN